MIMATLQQFVDAQEHGYLQGADYQTAFAELCNGQKRTHWIWYVLPQIKGLGGDETTELFAITDLQQAKDYAAHPILGARLRECCEVLLTQPTDDPMAIFGWTDAFKLHACMTLFHRAVPEEPLFTQVLEKFCMGREHDDTLALL